MIDNNDIFLSCNSTRCWQRAKMESRPVPQLSGIHLRVRSGAGSTPHCFRDRQEDRQGLRLWRCQGRVALASSRFVNSIHHDLVYVLPCLDSQEMDVILNPLSCAFQAFLLPSQRPCCIELLDQMSGLKQAARVNLKD